MQFVKMILSLFTLIIMWILYSGGLIKSKTHLNAKKHPENANA